MENVKVGDIILVDNFKKEGITISRHSFVVIDDSEGKVLGLDFDFIALIMSSFKSPEQKEQKLKFPGNFPITAAAEDVRNGNSREGFIKAEQFYYFNKEKISYRVIGELKPETLERLIDFIEDFPKKNVSIEQVVDNL